MRASPPRAAGAGTPPPTRLVSRVPVAPTRGMRLLRAAVADCRHDLGTAGGLALVPLVTVQFVTGDDGSATGECVGVQHLDVLALVLLHHGGREPRLHGQAVVADEVDVSDGQVGEVRRAALQVGEAQVGERCDEVALIPGLGHGRGDHDGVTAVGDALGNQAEQHLSLAHAHVVAQQGCAVCGDGGVGCDVRCALVGHVRAHHTWGRDRRGRGERP